ncbi:MAG: CpaF family protein [Lachnospiraceae bacterium]|nr:CpaF family protein [Lachnospiraceae bacterium]
MSETELKEVIDRVIRETSATSYLSVVQRRQYRKELFDTFCRYDVLSDVIEDPEVTEVMVNGPDRIFVEKNGILKRYEKQFSSAERLEDLIQTIVAKVNRQVNEANPIADARLENGDRVNVVLPPVALNGPVLTIRRFSGEPVTMEQLIGWGSLDPETAAYLKVLVVSGYNIFISGGTGSGKTTFLGALAAWIPKEQRVITIEDSAELQLPLDNLVRLEARPANTEQTGVVTIRDLLRTSLRMRPDRIIVGEIRSEEALDMLQAMNTGHDGSMSTGHGNSPKDMLFRMETMVLMGMQLPLSAVRRQISSAIEILVQLGRLRDGSRKVLSIQEITGMDGEEINLHSLFTFTETGEKDGKVQGKLVWSGEPLSRDGKLLRAGYRLPEQFRQ